LGKNILHPHRVGGASAQCRRADRGLALRRARTHRGRRRDCAADLGLRPGRDGAIGPDTAATAIALAIFAETAWKTFGVAASLDPRAGLAGVAAAVADAFAVLFVVEEIDQSPDDEMLVKRFESALERLGHGKLHILLARKLLSGRPYRIDTDNAESVRLARSIAADLGASIEEYVESGGTTRVVFKPAARS
jgi:hypothetical protein